MSTTECPTCDGPAVCWADNSDGLTVNFRCLNTRCKAGKGPWDTPEPVKDDQGYLVYPGYDRVGTRYVRSDTPCTCHEVSPGYVRLGCPRHAPYRPDSTD